jgi:Divergent InlB B-repeat domain
MKPKKLATSNSIIPLLAGLICLCWQNGASATTINFDDVPDSTVINTHYAGLTFTNPLGGNILARAGLGFAPSSPNVVCVTNGGTFPFFDARYGAVDVHFSTPVGVVRIDARPVGPVDSFLTPLTSRPYLQGLDSNGGYLGLTVYYSGALPTACCYSVGATETLVFVSPQGTNNIGVARFTCQPPGSNPTYGMFDNLSYDSGYYIPQIHIVGGGTVTNTPNATSYFYGTVVSFSAIPPPGSTFVGWSGNVSGTANPLSVTMTTNQIITANFAIVTNNSLTINAEDRGWYDVTGEHDPANANYYVGFDVDTTAYRNWFAFNVPTLTSPIASAQLKINTYAIYSPDGDVTYELSEVTNAVAILEAGGSGLTSIYADLGDGPVYAARTLLTNQSNRFETIPLGQTFRNAITAASGQPFAMGGIVVTNLNGEAGTTDTIFGYSGEIASDVQLILTFSNAPTVGYFTDNNASDTGPNAPILAAGYIPLQIFDISTQNLGGLRILMIDESDNSVISPTLAGKLPAIQSWVNAGGRLVVHDRSAGNITPNPFLLDASGASTVRLLAADIDVIRSANTLVTAGPFGIVDNLALDGGCSSEHGYVLTNNLPVGSRTILSVGGNSNQVVALSYPLGAGYLYYSTIPIDYYLGGGSCGAIGSNGPSIYLPNVLTYMHLLNPLLRFLPPSPPVGGTIQLFLANADNTPITADRVANLSIFATTNLSLPLSSWTLLGNPLTLSNGLVRVSGVNVTGQHQFFRAAEAP